MTLAGFRALVEENVKRGVKELRKHSSLTKANDFFQWHYLITNAISLRPTLQPLKVINISTSLFTDWSLMRLPARFTISTSPSVLLENRSHIFLSRRSRLQRTYIGTRTGPVFLQARLGILGGDQLQISIVSILERS